MNGTIRKQWTDALESKDYKQGQGALRSSTDNFCCLGVLCDLAVKAGVIPEPILDDTSFYTYGVDRDRSTSFLPDAVRNWAGMVYTPHALINMNDAGFPFKTIANWIKEKM